MTTLPMARRSPTVRNRVSCVVEIEPMTDVGNDHPRAIPIEQLAKVVLVCDRIDDRRRAVRDAYDRDRFQNRLIRLDDRYVAAGEAHDEEPPVPRHSA